MVKEKKLRIKKTIPLDPKEFRAFLMFLPSLLRTLVETYHFSCEAYAEIGLAYCWTEIFRLPASAVYKPEHGPCQILLYRTSSHGSRSEEWYGRYIPNRFLSKKLLELSEANKGGLLFQMKDGRGFSAVHLKREFDLASRKALEKKAIKQPISPSRLRMAPSSDIKFHPGTHREVSEETVQSIAKILPQTAYRNAGRRREKPLKSLLEVLLAQNDFEYSRSELMRCFPLAIAAESQKKRWQDLGIWSQILRILLR